MSQEYTLVRDIVSGHNERMHNIKKYYPFFKVSQISFGQYMEGKYEVLDMGYILMAVLRFFIEENNFREKPVTYEEYAGFMHDLYRRDFELAPDKQEEKELTGYIFDKIKNDGKPFTYTYYDPETKQKKTMRTRLLESKLLGEGVVYYITSDAVAFYLDTKEIKEESNLTVAQVLLSKMISSKNFKGGAEVARRINHEVSKLMADKNEIVGLMSYDVFAGVKRYEEFMSGTVKWFEEEQKLFEKNKELIRQALKNCENDVSYHAALEDIYLLEDELNKAMNKHTKLLEACVLLQRQTDEIIAASKLNRIKMAFDFRKMLSQLMQQNDVTPLEAMIRPLLKPAVRKTFSLSLLDNLLGYKGDQGEAAEKTVTQQEENFRYPDEWEDERIFHNYLLFFEVLLEMVKQLSQFDLHRFNEALAVRLGEKVLVSADYYSFLVHLCQKKDYCMAQTIEKPDTFLEEMIRDYARQEEGFEEKVRQISFSLTFTGEAIKNGAQETENILFRSEDI